MAHEITKTDRLAYVGEHPWHLGETGVDGRSVRIGETPVAVREAFKVALPWEPALEPIFLGNGTRVEDHFAVTRSDGLGALGVVGKKYTPFHNASMADLAEALVKEGALAHTVGSLQGGRRVFCAIQAGDRVELLGGRDAIDPYLMLSAAHDGSGSLEAIFTTVRPVCANTVAMAKAGARVTFKKRHTAAIGDLEAVAAEAREVLGIAQKAFEEQAEVARILSSVPMSKADMQLFACEVLTGKDGEEALRAVGAAKGRSATMYDRKGEELVALFYKGLGNEGKTLWDGLNSVTEWIDHQRGRSADFRAKQKALGLDSALFGDGAKKKARAVELLLRRVRG